MKQEFMSFAERVRENMEEATGKEVRLNTVRKNNGVVLVGVTVNDEAYNMCPTLYLERYYKMYEEGDPFKDIFMKLHEDYNQHKINRTVDISFFEDYEQVKPLLGFKLINADMNDDLLKEVPHKRFLNFAVVCFCEAPMEISIVKGFILIRNEHINIWGIKAEELIEDAILNMQKTNPADVINMTDLLKELYDEPAQLICHKLPMWVLTNSIRSFGAGALLYDNQLEKLAEEIGGDFYMFPSSIHEVIILPKKYGGTKEEMIKMVHEVNEEQVDIEERLSEDVYFYSISEKELKII